MAVQNVKPLVLTTALLILHNICSTEARSVPRSSSRTFRFPGSDEDTNSVLFADRSLFVAKRVVGENSSNFFPSEKPQGRNNVININDTPIKILVPESPEKTNKALDESLSVEVDTTSGANNNSTHEDEPLLEVLCPPSEQNVSSTLSEDGNESSGSWSSTESRIRYDLRVGKCAEVGNQGHCGKNMIFVADIDSSAYGYCECDYENKVLRKEMKQSALFTKTPLVFHQKSNACHRLYEQAYCDDGEWLVLSRQEKGPVCERRQCSNTGNPGNKEVSTGTAQAAPVSRRRASKLLTPSFWTDNPSTSPPTTHGNESESGNGTKSESVWVPLNGSGPCVQLFANNPGHCADNEQVVFKVGDIVPKCGTVGRGIEGRAIIRNACPPGSYYSIIGRCQPDWDF